MAQLRTRILGAQENERLQQSKPIIFLHNEKSELQRHSQSKSWLVNPDSVGSTGAAYIFTIPL